VKRLQVVMLLVVPALAALAQAGTFTTLYNFTGGTDGGQPNAAVIQDEFGNLYGTTSWGGDLSCGSYNSGCGVVYKLDTAGNETVLHSFSKTDGQNPFAPVIRDSDGNLYGTTDVGGSSSYGTVFKLDTAGNETVLHSFAGGTSDGCYPSGVIMDGAGSLYGTASECGTSNDGTVFKIDTAGNETILHNFTGSDGRGPNGGHLILDKAGNLYGVAGSGGPSGYGVLYKLSKEGTLTLLHSFANSYSDGCYPVGTVAKDKAGNFYGTTWECGSHRDGVVWRVSKTGAETDLHNFDGSKEGCWPTAGVVRDSQGNLYGNTSECGIANTGTVWELSPKGKLTLLHSFLQIDGADPSGELLRTAKGTLYGATSHGGSYGGGTVWKYEP
jgi:uncharacterized repeat protein (TIGR03803 family)